jgi:NADPH-dependent 2,4-dienoyl-CoA reductase/sulfur reductase-like enzyme
MKHYKYVIVGGGLTGDAAARGIRELDENGTIGMISAETDPPYVRPNLSKGLWKGRPIQKIWRNTEDLGVDMHLGRSIVSLDSARKLLKDDQGEQYGFEKLLLATGGSPAQLPFGNGSIIYYRDLQDFRRLHQMAENGDDFLVIGGGFIGSEIAAALNMNGKHVAMVFPEAGIGANIFPAELSRFLNDFYQEKGVEVLPGDTVTSVEPEGEYYVAHTKNGRTFKVNGVVAGIGIRPNLDLAQQAGLQTDNGIVVDEQLKTSVPDIYAAGDVANFFHSALEKRLRVEHEDNALRMGKQAGRNMAGAEEPYTHVPMFYSDLFDLGYEAVGEMSSRMETVSDWQEPFQKGTIYYLKDGRVRGVLLWNVWKMIPAARELLSEPGPFDAEQLKGRFAEKA